jgi:long-chain acyl-CoA synthetase
VKSRSREKRAEPDFEDYRIIGDFLIEQTRREGHPDDHVEFDLGLDSLDEENTNKLTVESIRWADILKQKVDLKLPRGWVTQDLVKNFSRVFCELYFRLKGEGVENIPEGPFILASNHQSFFDGLFISVFLRNKMMKNTYFYAKEKHLRIGWLKALAKRSDIIVMDINRDLKQSLQKLAEVPKRGKNVIIFPEGTRTPTGAVGTFTKAFAILSRQLTYRWCRSRSRAHSQPCPEGASYRGRGNE